MSEKQPWDGHDRRQTAIEVAGQAKTELEKHLVECTARYNVLKGEVQIQGKQNERIEKTVAKIDDKLDNILVSINATIDKKIDAIDQKVEDQGKLWNDRTIQVLTGIIAITIGVIGWFLDHFVFK